MAKIYIGMSVDILHHGHVNIIANARQHGDVVVGLLTDAAIADHKRLPYLDYEQRKIITHFVEYRNTSKNLFSAGLANLLPENTTGLSSPLFWQGYAPATILNALHLGESSPKATGDNSL